MYTISSEVVKIRKVELRMNEQVKYDVIKKLVETNGNKKACRRHSWLHPQNRQSPHSAIQARRQSSFSAWQSHAQARLHDSGFYPQGNPLPIRRKVCRRKLSSFCTASLRKTNPSRSPILPLGISSLRRACFPQKQEKPRKRNSKPISRRRQNVQNQRGKKNSCSRRLLW